MEIKGTITTITEIEKVTDTFSKRTIVINTGGEYPKDVAIEFSNKNMTKLDNFGSGQEVTVFFDAESRKYNERYYTSLRGWKVEN